jgi:hypothetical protein
MLLLFIVFASIGKDATSTSLTIPSGLMAEFAPTDKPDL